MSYSLLVLTVVAMPSHAIPSDQCYVLDPTSGEARGLLLPPFNALPSASTRATIPVDCPLHEAKSVAEADRLGVNGCLVGMCVRGDELYVSTTWHGEERRVLHLSRTPTTDDKSEARIDKGAAVVEGKKEELGYKKGFLLDISG